MYYITQDTKIVSPNIWPYKIHNIKNIKNGVYKNLNMHVHCS